MGDYIPVDKMNRRLAEIEDQIRDLQHEQDLLKKWIQQAVDPSAHVTLGRVRFFGGGAGHPTHDASELPTTVEVENLVRALPGLTRGEIADRLKDQIKSTSRNKRRLVYNTAFNLVNRGVLEDREGRLFIAGQDNDEGQSMFSEEEEVE